MEILVAGAALVAGQVSSLWSAPQSLGPAALENLLERSARVWWHRKGSCATPKELQPGELAVGRAAAAELPPPACGAQVVRALSHHMGRGPGNRTFPWGGKTGYTRRLGASKTVRFGRDKDLLRHAVATP